MEMKLDFEVPAPYLFEQLTNSILYDIEQQTGRKLRPRQLPNFQFEKTFRNQAHGQFKITDYRVPEIYAYQLRTSKNCYRVSYQLVSLSQTGVQLVYQETMDANSKTIAANNRLTQLIFGWQRKRRMRKMRDQIVQQYQQTKQ
ncbi:DUF3284 domain-containing protein [Bombilactobacillus folatiphilus]|uniref:DUF3284 domain-containing protein n=1 Tax=Bombilactobacillus folatiphilus TaxID=2923362 RepID=A0ABY4P850_9LACO|nr:DUF3284 domain-containing protein [Bombilactobacillus folatiphilus]UQS81874.1 DUF3284 domain-containing protein [Bombilactobacillus folatiphilus]